MITERLAEIFAKFPPSRSALDILVEDFADPDGDGAHALAMFLRGHADDDVQQDVAGVSRQITRFFGM